MLKVFVVIRQHEGVVDSRKGLVVGIFEKAGRTYRDRIGHNGNNRREVLLYSAGEVGLEKCIYHLLITVLTESNLVEVVFIHKIVKNLGGQNYRSRYGDHHSGELC